jgi:N-dimethylarginine dimethylaminohydrolase
MPVASTLAEPPPSAAQLIEVLAVLGKPVTVHSGDPAPTVLHLARLLVAVAERHAIAAELALGAGARDGH